MTAILSLLTGIIGLALSLWFLADFCLGVVHGFGRNKILWLVGKLALALLLLHFHFELEIFD